MLPTLFINTATPGGMSLYAHDHMSELFLSPAVVGGDSPGWGESMKPRPKTPDAATVERSDVTQTDHCSPGLSTPRADLMREEKGMRGEKRREIDHQS